MIIIIFDQLIDLLNGVFCVCHLKLHHLMMCV